MTVAAGVPVYCLTCARPAQLMAASIDPRWVIALCRYSMPDGSVRGCGQVPATRDKATAEAVVERRRTERRARDHRQGKHAVHPISTCPDCFRDIAHKRHVDARRPEVGCEQCAQASQRARPARHAR